MDRSIASDCQKLLQTPWQRGSPACIQRGQFWSLHSSPPPGSGFCRDHGADHQQPRRNGVVHTDRHLPPVRGHSCWRHTSHRCTCCKSLPQQRFIWILHCETQLNTHTHSFTPCTCSWCGTDRFSLCKCVCLSCSECWNTYELKCRHEKYWVLSRKSVAISIKIFKY